MMYRYTRRAKSAAHRAVHVLVAMLLCSVAMSAQLEVGENIKMKLNGNLGFGYGGSFGNANVQSNSNRNLTGSADLTGYYFHPSFLSFDFRPYYDRSQANSESQTITRASGLGGSVSLFGGSRFPGSISYGKDFSSNSELRVAGVPSLVGDSSGQNFGISWGAYVQGLPTLSAAYSIGSSSSSVIGSDNSQNSTKNLTLNSAYKIAGFDLQGNLSHFNNSFTTPSYLTGETWSNDGSSTTYGLSAQHKLPLNGSVNLSWAHSNSASDNGGDWSNTTYTVGNSFTPWNRISLNQTVSYSTNIVGVLEQSILSGAGASSLRSDKESEGLFYTAGATYRVVRGLSVTGRLSHRVQSLMGGTYEDTQYGGSLNFNHSNRFLGIFYAGIGVVDTASKAGNDGAGLTATLGMSRKFGHWDTSADFNYTQDVQTIGSITTTSTYSYGVSTRRRINQDTQFGGSVRASHSGLTAQTGDGNASESASGFFSWKRYSVSGTYSQARGTAVLNSSGGLTPTPEGPLFTNDFLLFNARSYSASASTRLFRRVSVVGSYSKFTSSTAQLATGTFSTGDRYSFRTEYRLRKFSFLGSFSRTNQDVSTIVGGPRVVNSYYLSLSRWFNVF